MCQKRLGICQKRLGISKTSRNASELSDNLAVCNAQQGRRILKQAICADSHVRHSPTHMALATVHSKATGSLLQAALRGTEAIAA